MAEVTFAMTWEVTCARCGATTPERTTLVTASDNTKIKYVHEIACAQCDEKIAYLMKALELHGTHKPDCLKIELSGECTCGWEAIQEALAELLEE